tara:strand:+ start:5500 stop:5640 length:141 start_codon:yes stop_codon:yes gene_type:complete
MKKSKTTFAKMGPRGFRVKKKEGTLTQRERYLKRKKAQEEFKAWFK